jgi:prolyl-tRNA editing enzyme YbaK/EbsC (Cys-tRNA(Pro) deacylase)
MDAHCGKKDLAAFHPLRSKYYAVIVQYTDKLSSKKLNDFVKKLSEMHPSSSKEVHLRLAPEEVSFQLTGYPSGGVCPIGMSFSIPIILSEKVLQLSPGVIFMG